jgi:hypothetical protein
MKKRNLKKMGVLKENEVQRKRKKRRKWKELKRTRKRKKIITIIIIILLFILTAYEFLPGGNGTTIRGSGEKEMKRSRRL